MRDFNRGGGFKKSFGKGRDEKKLFQATCGDCGTRCEVPFRPTGERPVYCRDCFSKHPAPAFDRGEGSFKRPFNPAGNRSFGDRRERPSFRSEPTRQPSADSAQIGALTQEIKLLNGKIDDLIRAMETQRTHVEAPAVSAVKKPAKAKAKKAATSKKK